MFKQRCGRDHWLNFHFGFVSTWKCLQGADTAPTVQAGLSADRCCNKATLAESFKRQPNKETSALLYVIYSVVFWAI